jgi:hypothetical protein
MPAYGLAPASEGLLPWSWAVERLERSHNYWLSTARADGRPHAMAVWAVWLDDTLLFSTGSSSRKARNLDRAGDCVITTERADEAVIVEGVAELVRDPALLARLRPVYLAKYDSGYPEDSNVYAVRPVVAFGFQERAEAFAASATRWTFGAAGRA